MKNIKELMEWRFACKKFDLERSISETDLKEIMEVARLAPSSFGLQAWKFIVVTNAELKAKLAPVCYNQPQITQAAALVFCCARTDILGENGVLNRYSETYKAISGKTEEEVGKFKEMITGIVGMKGESIKDWVQKQVYIPAELLILAAAEKGIDSCPMEGFDPAGVAKVLELPEYMFPTVLVSLGYRNMEQPKKVRFDFDDVVEIRA